LNPREITIGTTRIADDTDCYVIAEIGQNHQGDVGICKQLIDEAADCGCRAVKIQKRNNRKLYTKVMYDQPYDHENSFGDTYGTHREFLEFDAAQYRELKAHAESRGVDFFATAWDFDSADFLNELGVPAYKIASGDLYSIPLLKYVAKFGKPMIVSTGGATMADVERAFNAIHPINPQIILLQCTAAYPVQPEQMNLGVLSTFRGIFPDTVVGLSDHQDGIAMSILAYAFGARVFEKHFTLHRSWKGGDHAFSLEPGGMKRMVRDLERARTAVGNGVKEPIPSEAKPLMKMRKKIVAARDLTAGTVLTEADLAYKSPGDGMPPYEFEKLLGKRLSIQLAEDDGFALDMVE
jgi:N-acetylneuraminate synthase/sialic acid synthase